MEDKNSKPPSDRASHSNKSFADSLRDLGPFWEQIEFPNGTIVGPGRSKALLWKKYLSHYIGQEKLAGKSILDIGCNAGGNLVELAKNNPSRLVGVEANLDFHKQAVFVIDAFKINAEVKHYRVAPNKTPQDYADDLGTFDIIFLLGVIYHLNRDTNLNLLRYIKQNCHTCYFSSQLFASDKRTGVDWELTHAGHEALFREAGFTSLTTIYEKTDLDDWSGLTNQWYFEAA